MGRIRRPGVNALIAASPILLVIGYLLDALGAAMAVPLIIDIDAGNSDWKAFVGSASLILFVGTVLVLANHGRAFALNPRQSVILTVMAWLVIAVAASLPFAFSGMNLGYADAFFEAISGLTTTGSTVMVGLDIAPPGILMWRGILQWMGGIGVIVMGMAILPALRIAGMQLFRIESSEHLDRPVPRFRHFLVALTSIYVGLTFICAILLGFAGMTAFDAVIHAMTTLSTGGYSTADASIGHFANPAAEWIITVFMVMGSIPFVLYMRALQGRPRLLLFDGQVLCLVVFLVVVIVAVAIWLAWIDGVEAGTALRMAAFNITSIVTTTGYSSADYTQWGSFPLGVFFIITVVGGCTGSTAGGIKIFRFQLFWVLLRSNLRGLISPNVVRVPMYDGRPIAPDAAAGGILYVCLFVVTIAAVSALLEAMGLDLVTAVSAAATSVANVGPGLGAIIGPAGNFSALPDAAKWLLAFAMLLGRLEILAVLLLFTPEFWRG